MSRILWTKIEAMVDRKIAEAMSRSRTNMSDYAAEQEAAFYEEAEGKGGNTSHGLEVVGNGVLVRVIDPPKQTAGGVWLPDEHVDRLKYSGTDGEIVAISPWAFGGDDWPDEASRPKIGDRIVFPKYAGGKVEGNDGVEYRMLNDDEILARRIR
jgi:co-chaperonin GroES (HSP10)